MQIKILSLCGSSRRDSLNRQLLDIASLGAVDAGAQVSLMRWLDFPLPIYDGDWEAEHGLPERACVKGVACTASCAADRYPRV